MEVKAGPGGKLFIKKLFDKTFMGIGFFKLVDARSYLYLDLLVEWKFLKATVDVFGTRYHLLPLWFFKWQSNVIVKQKRQMVFISGNQ